MKKTALLLAMILAIESVFPVKLMADNTITVSGDEIVGAATQIDLVADTQRSYFDKYSYKSDAKGYPLFTKIIVEDTTGKFYYVGDPNSSPSLNEDVDVEVYIDGNLVQEKNNKNYVIASTDNWDEFYNEGANAVFCLESYLGYYNGTPGKHDVKTVVKINGKDRLGNRPGNNDLILKTEFSGEVEFVDESGQMGEMIYPKDSNYILNGYGRNYLYDKDVLDNYTTVPVGENVEIQNLRLNINFSDDSEKVTSAKLVKHATEESVCNLSYEKASGANYYLMSDSRMYYSNFRIDYYDNYVVRCILFDDIITSKLEAETDYDILVTTSTGKKHRFENRYHATDKPFIVDTGIAFSNHTFSDYITAYVYGINVDNNLSPIFYSSDGRKVAAKFDNDDPGCRYFEGQLMTSLNKWEHFYGLKKEDDFKRLCPPVDRPWDSIYLGMNDQNIEVYAGFSKDVQHTKDGWNDNEQYEVKYDTNSYNALFAITGDKEGKLYIDKTFASVGDIVELRCQYYKDGKYDYIFDRMKVYEENGILCADIDKNNQIWAAGWGYYSIKNINKNSKYYMVSTSSPDDIADFKPDYYTNTARWEIHEISEIGNTICAGRNALTNEDLKLLNVGKLYDALYFDKDGKWIGSTEYYMPEEGRNKPTPSGKVEPIVVKGNEITVTLPKGDKIAVDLLAKAAEDKDWKIISNASKKIATLSKSGVIKGLKKGMTIMTVFCNNTEYSVTVNVEAPRYTKKSILLNKGQSIDFPLADTQLAVTYESSAPAIATVDAVGTIKAVGKGSAKIRAHVGNKSYTLKVKVEAPVISLTSVSINCADPVKLRVVGTKSKVYWSSTNPAVAAYKKGKIVPKSVGNTKITAMVNGEEMYCSVYVNNL